MESLCKRNCRWMRFEKKHYYGATLPTNKTWSFSDYLLKIKRCYYSRPKQCKYNCMLAAAKK